MNINIREKILIVSVVTLLVLIGIKSIFLDEFRATTEAELQMVLEANQFIENKYDNILYNSHFLSTRIIEVMETEEHLTKVHYRKYVVYIFPFGDEYKDIE